MVVIFSEKPTDACNCIQKYVFVFVLFCCSLTQHDIITLLARVFPCNTKTKQNIWGQTQRRQTLSWEETRQRNKHSERHKSKPKQIRPIPTHRNGFVTDWSCFFCGFRVLHPGRLVASQTVVMLFYESLLGVSFWFLFFVLWSSHASSDLVVLFWVFLMFFMCFVCFIRPGRGFLWFSFASSGSAADS